MLEEEEPKPLKILFVPELGKVGVEVYDLPAMPIPEMVNIEAVRFDFKNSIRNPDYRQGRQYENEAIKQLFPEQYSKRFVK